MVDSYEEIARLAYYAEAAGVRPRVLVRVTTGVEAHTHEFIATAHEDQKFGFSLASGAADEAVRRVLALPELEFAGLHSHIGSQIFDTGGFEVAAHECSSWPRGSTPSTASHVAELDLGGGFGIAYVPEDDAPEAKIWRPGCARSSYGVRRRSAGPLPRMAVEPGRASSGRRVTLYEVGTIKDVDGIRTYVRVDGGMSDNIRTALYDASYTWCSRPGPPTRRRCCPGSSESTVRAATSWCATATFRPIWRRGICWRSRPPGLTAGAGQQLQPLARPGWSRCADGATQVLMRRETLDDLLRLDSG